MNFKRLILSLFLMIVVSCSQGNKEVSSDQLVTRQGMTYEINSEKPFTGIATDVHPNGQISLNAEYADGLLDGKEELYDENGNLISSTLYLEGNKSIRETFDIEKNTKKIEKFIDQGHPILSLEFNSEGKPISTNLFDEPVGIFYQLDEDYENLLEWQPYLLSDLEPYNGLGFQELIADDGYISGKRVFDFSDHDQFQNPINYYVNEDQEPIKNGTIRFTNFSPFWIFAEYDDLKKCSSVSSCELLYGDAKLQTIIELELKNYFVVKRKILLPNDQLLVAYSVDKDGGLNYDPDFPKEYYEDGRVKFERIFKSDELIEERAFRDDGSLQQIRIFTDAVPSFLKRFYENGSILRETELIDEFGKTKTFHTNGQIAEIYTSIGYLSQKTGSYKAYLPDGTMVIESSFKDGDLDGECKIFNDEGSEVASWLFFDGETYSEPVKNGFRNIVCNNLSSYGIYSGNEFDHFNPYTGEVQTSIY